MICPNPVVVRVIHAFIKDTSHYCAHALLDMLDSCPLCGQTKHMSDPCLNVPEYQSLGQRKSRTLLAKSPRKRRAETSTKAKNLLTQAMQYNASKRLNIQILTHPRIASTQRELITVCIAPKFVKFPRVCHGCGVNYCSHITLMQLTGFWAAQDNLTFMAYTVLHHICW